MFAVTLTWAWRNCRVAAVVAALAVFLVTILRAEPPAGWLEALVVILPAIEVALFIGVFAIVADEPAEPAQALLLLVLWAGGAFVCMLAVVRGVQAGIDAYVRLGVPPVFGAMP